MIELSKLDRKYILTGNGTLAERGAVLDAFVVTANYELNRALSEQRRRMGAEYDALDAELKRVQEAAATMIAAFT